MSGPMSHEDALNQLHEMFGAVDGAPSEDQWTRENLEMVLILQKSNLQQSIQTLLENMDKKPEAIIRKLLEKDPNTPTGNGLMPKEAPSGSLRGSQQAQSRRPRRASGGPEEEKSSIHERHPNNNSSNTPEDSRFSNSIRQSQASLLSRQSSASQRSSAASRLRSHPGRNSKTPIPFEYVFVERSGLEAVNGQYHRIDPDYDVPPTRRHYYQYTMVADWEGDVYTFSLEKKNEDNCWYLCAKPKNTDDNGNGNDKINLFYTPERGYRRTYRQYPRLRGWKPCEQITTQGIRGIAPGTEIEPPKLRYD